MRRAIVSMTVATAVVAIMVGWATIVAYAQSPPAGVDVAPATSPTPARAAAATTDDSVVLNFEGADIREVIHSLADALAINYQIDPRIQGQVTIRTTGTISKQDLFPVFNQILRSNGISAVKVGDIYQIIPVAEAKTKAARSSRTRS
jgi:type II secretory pathway component GspD/PulD (secretin)